MQARLLSDRQKAWQNIQVDTDLGVDCEHLKWQQNQTYVEIFALLPARIQPSQVLSTGTSNACRMAS